MLLSARFSWKLISQQCLPIVSGEEKLFLFSSSKILQLSARPESGWDWLWKCQTLQTSNFCWCWATQQCGECHILLREKKTTLNYRTANAPAHRAWWEKLKNTDLREMNSGVWSHAASACWAITPIQYIQEISSLCCQSLRHSGLRASRRATTVLLMVPEHWLWWKWMIHFSLCQKKQMRSE